MAVVQCQQAQNLSRQSRLIPCCSNVKSQWLVKQGLPQRKSLSTVLVRARSSDTEPSGNQTTGSSLDSVSLPENFCIIESREAVKDFANMQVEEIRNNIQARRNKIFLLMEEVRRLRIQQRVKGGEVPKEAEVLEEKYLSALPFLPQLTEQNLNSYFTFYAAMVMAIIIFGGVLAPILEVKLGLGGTTYLQFVQSMHLPSQLAEVDPIVASFCGGAVGVLSALLVVEINNVKKQQATRCMYCQGSGYLMCGNCVGAGVTGMETLGGTSVNTACAFCAGTGKVMCTTCLCTGKQLATEHDPRIDPFL